MIPRVLPHLLRPSGSTSTLATPLARRTLSTTPPRLDGERDPAKPLSQGHATRKADRLHGGLDVQSAQVLSGRESVTSPSSDGVHDTAAESKGNRPRHSAVQAEEASREMTPSQRAALGSFKDHRGGAQSTVGEGSGEVQGTVEATPPSFTASVKQALGMSTSKADHKESKTVPGRQLDNQ